MAFKGALEDVTYGLYLITAEHDGRRNGLIVNTVVQVSNAPEKISVCISKNSLTHDIIMQARCFAVSILDRDAPMKFIGTWGFRSGRDIDKFEGVSYRKGATGAPIVLDHCLGYLEVQLFGTLDVESHTIFVGKIVETEKLAEGEPMTYRYYKEVKGGKASRYAPTFNDWETLKKLEGRNDVTKDEQE